MYGEAARQGRPFGGRADGRRHRKNRQRARQQSDISSEQRQRKREWRESDGGEGSGRRLRGGRRDDLRGLSTDPALTPRDYPARKLLLLADVLDKLAHGRSNLRETAAPFR